MSDSIVYEYSNIAYSDNLNLVKLVQWKEQVISIKWELKGIKIKNITTQKSICEIDFNSIYNFKMFPGGVTACDYCEKKAFMYSHSILWIGSVLNCWGLRYVNKKQYIICLIDLDLSTCVKSWCPNLTDSIRSIHPVGSKYFIVVKEESSEPLEDRNINYVYAWTDLVKLDKTMVPVYQIKHSDSLCAVNWESSSIKQLGLSELVLISSENLMVFLDKNFKQILTLGISDIFSDYEPEPDSEKAIIKFNANCLVFYEKKKSNVGIFNVYCWDFTTNTQIKFPKNKIQNNSVFFPFRTTNSKVKFLVGKYLNAINYYNYQICESEVE